MKWTLGPLGGAASFDISEFFASGRSKGHSRRGKWLSMSIRIKSVVRLCVLVVVVPFLVGCAPACEERFRRSSNALMHVVLFCKDANNKDALQRGVDQWLRANGDGLPISQIIASSNPDEAKIAGNPNLVGIEDARGFDRITGAFYANPLANSRLAYTFPILRRLRARDTVLTTFREGSETGEDIVFEETQRQASGGSSVSRGGIFPEVLWFAAPSPRDHLHVFANVPDIPTCSICEQISRKVLALGLPENTQGVVSVRQTPWFELDGFPLIFKFVRHRLRSGDSRRRFGLIVPTVGEYYQAKEVRCQFGRYADKSRCSVSGTWYADELPKAK